LPFWLFVDDGGGGAGGGDKTIVGSRSFFTGAGAGSGAAAAAGTGGDDDDFVRGTLGKAPPRVGLASSLADAVAAGVEVVEAGGDEPRSVRRGAEGPGQSQIERCESVAIGAAAPANAGVSPGRPGAACATGSGITGAGDGGPGGGGDTAIGSADDAFDIVISGSSPVASPPSPPAAASVGLPS
jgi:hypothetical protein